MTIKFILAAINFWCLRWPHMVNPKKAKSMVVSRSQTSASGYGNLTLGGAELKGLKRLRILGVTLDSVYKISQVLLKNNGKLKLLVNLQFRVLSH